MTVLEMMKKIKNEHNKQYLHIANKDDNNYEYVYGLTGYSSIENNEYVERYKDIFNKEVIKVETRGTEYYIYC